MVFCTCAICPHCKPARATHHRKMRFRTVHNGPWTLQNQTGGDPKREKNDQHEQKTPNKCARDGQERKKDAQERKMCQHGPNMAESKFPAALP